MVLDPFCGCGTAVHAAEKLDRKWIGIDITHLAIGLVRRRINDAFPGVHIDVIGEPADLQSALELARRDKYQFQWWVCDKIGALPVSGKKKKGADQGRDGIVPFFAAQPSEYKQAIVSVKAGDNVGVGMVRELIAVLKQQDSPIGVLITVAPATQPMITEAAAEGSYQNAFWQKSYPRLQILTIDQIMDGKRPKLPPGKSPFAKAVREEDTGAYQAKF